MKQNPLGVLDFYSWNHPWNNFHYPPEVRARSLTQMQEAGVGILRFDFLWSDIEPADGQFAFQKYDELVAEVRGAGIEILGVLNYSPEWHRPNWNLAPEPARYGAYVAKVVSHYKGKVSHWELWNEPDHPIYFDPQDGMKTYSELLKQTYPIAKNVNPDAILLMGGLSQALPKSLEQIYELAGKDVFDVVNIHPFLSPLMPDAVGSLQYFYQMIHKTMNQFDDAKKPIWITEIGCPGIPKQQSIPNWWLGKNPVETHQAGWVEQAYTTLLKCPGVEKIFWAFFRDTPDHFHNGVDYFGLVRQDGSAKPSYETYRSLTRFSQVK